MTVKRRRSWTGSLVALLLLAAAGAGGVMLWQHYGDSLTPPDEADAVAMFPAEQGPLVISVTESGTIAPRDQVIIKSEVEGSATILSLVPEGKLVEKGDLLIELDTSKLVDNKLDQEIRVQNAESSFVQSRENLEVVKNQASSDVEKAELAVRFAKEDLHKYTEGEYPNQRANLESKIAIAQEEVQRTEEKLKWSKQLHQEKYISDTELQADELAAKKAKLDLELARSNLALLEEYTYKRQVAQLTSDVRQAEMALERVKRKARADVIQAEAQLRARESELKQQRDKLTKISEQIEKARIIAPIDGLVVYATSTQFRWRGNTEPLDEGQQVRERQELIYLPTANTFNADVDVHEASLKKVYPGLPVRLTIDALPGKRFTGTVAKIAPMPDARSMFMNPDLKLYKTTIHVEGGADVLRTGMTCKAEILVKRYENTVYVPVQCVVRRGAGQVVYVVRGENPPEARTVTIGLDNNRMVAIEEGLDPGEQVLLNPPLGGTETPVEEADAADVDIPAPPAGKRGAGGPAPAGSGGSPGGRRPDGSGGGERGRRGEEAGRGDRGGDGGRGKDAGGGAGGGDGADRGGERPPVGGAESAQGMRERFANMSEEERAQMRERIRNMSPEEREQLRSQFGGGRSSGEGGGREGGREGRRGGAERGGRRGPGGGGGM